MKDGAKLLGHSIHPMLIVFPLGLLATAVIFDLLRIFLENSTFALVSYWLIAAGIVGGLMAAVFGWIDWLAIPTGTRAKNIGLTHGLVNTVVLALFAGSWYLRRDDPARPEMLASALAFAGAAVSLVGGWLGGELVERLGVGVHPGANANAPSSLSTDSVLGAEVKKT